MRGSVLRRSAMKKALSVLLAVVTAGVLATAATRAFGAEEGGGPTARGACSLGSEWSLHMGREIGIEFEIEINSGVPGQTWRVELMYNKHTLLRTTEKTEEDGGFEIRKVENNAPGIDVGSIRATNPDTGETCQGQLTAEL
jgi:hypothetical protein